MMMNHDINFKRVIKKTYNINILLYTLHSTYIYLYDNM